MLRFALLLLTGLVVTAAAEAAVIKATVTGVTRNSNVISGDPCATGLSGAGGCDNQSLVFEFLIDDVLAPPDQNVAPSIGCFCYFATSPHSTIFLTGTASLNGQQFSSIPAPAPAVQPLVFRQLVILKNNVAGAGDSVALQLDGESASGGGAVDRRFNVNTNVDVPILTLAAPRLSSIESLSISSADIVFEASGFEFMSPTGHVTGGFAVTSMVFSLVPEPSLAALLALGGCALALVRSQRRARA